MTIEDLLVPVISRRHFAINKKAAGRTKDLLDLALLEELDNGR